MLDPDAVAARSFGTSFRGYDPDEVRRFLAEVAEELRSLASGVVTALDGEQASALIGEETARLLDAARASAAAIETKAEERAAEVLREAQEEAIRLRSSVESERDRAYAEGAQRAEEVLADAERAAAAEVERLVGEAEAARELVLGDLARRRKSVRSQVEQLHAAREKLLDAFADVQRTIDDARGRLVVALPEARVAADAAARRVEAEPDTTVEHLESELEAFRLVGIPLGPVVEAPDGGHDDGGGGDGDVPVAVAEDVPVDDVEVVDGGEEPEPGSVEPAAEPEVDAAEADVAVEAEAEVDVEAEVEVETEVDPVGERSPEAGGAEPAPPPVAAVDALFARLRAGREARVADAEAVLAEPVEAHEPDEAGEPGGTEGPARDEETDETAVHVGGGDERDELLARRDSLLDAPLASLAKHLKRLLADEQNAVLDAIRRGVVDAAAVPSPDDLAPRWADAAAVDLAAAARAGSVFLIGHCPEDDVAVDVGDIAAELAANVAAPLAERLAAAVQRADGERELAVDAVRSTCREWRSRRLADGVELAVRAAFGRGVLASAAPGSRLCWVVDDGGSPCPDAEDNALAGPVVVGDPYPTGHRHPPAHPGCRCVLALADA